MTLLRMMTFNIRGSFHQDGVNTWENRRALNFKVLRQAAPHILGIQEAQHGNLEDYAAELTAYDMELGLVSIRQAEDYHRVPVWWKQDTLEKVTSGGFYLSATPQVWSPSWGSSLARAATWAHLRVRATGQEMVVLNTHFPHETELHGARTAAAQLVVHEMARFVAQGLPVVVMADFNALPESDAHRVFADAGYVDTYHAAPDAGGSRAEVNTYHGFDGEGFVGKGIRLDWILTHNGAARFTTVRCSVLTDHDAPLYPSDHYPVLAEVELS